MTDPAPTAEPELHAVAVQLIDLPDGILVKRGITELQVSGEGAGPVLQTILTRAARGARREAILEAFSAEERDDAATLIDALVARRLLTENDSVSVAETPLDIFYWHFSTTRRTVAEQKGTGPIVVIGVNDISRQLVRSLLESGVSSVSVVADSELDSDRYVAGAGGRWPSDLPVPLPRGSDPLSVTGSGCVVATSDVGGMVLLRQWNARCVAEGRVFVPVLLQNLIGFVGPLIVPGETACYECVRARQNSHMENAELQRASEYAAREGQAILAFHPSMASILGDIAAIELGKFSGGYLRSRLPARLIEVNLLEMELRQRQVLRVPSCLVCGSLFALPSPSADEAVLLPGHARE